MKSALFTMVNLLLMAAVSYIAVGLFYQLATANLEVGPTVEAAAAVAAPSPEPPPKPLRAYQAIAERDFFRTDAAQADTGPSTAVDLASLEQTELELKLWGTLVSEGGTSYAVIEDKREGGQDLYQAGDKIQDARVKMILRERVVLDVKGKDEILQLEDLAAVTAAPRTAPGSGGPGPSPPPSGPVVRSVRLERKTIEDALGNVGELMKQVRIRPFFQGGKPAGLSMSGIAPGSIFQRMGVRNGDVLQAVDGQPIRSVDDVVNLYQSLGSADNVALQVRRGGRVQDLRFQID